ncbi:uncharacterized protein LOC126979636 isoform X2 [Leptidea sinapis]|uniref:uncharacterized protein LOC126979636 isoform X2 n=1 Tax=Leptidea sinapis TaxID=189913 RepID=UPI0021425090|nr:uncharacterized protein LOC126979636 isoform X2 [Leptidea sinapis]
MYLKMYIKSERFYQPENQQLKDERCFSDYDEDIDEREGGGGAARRFARDAASPAQAHAAAIQPSHTAIKNERLSPHESSASRSRSVTPSTSSYPGTPPERGSPHAPPAPAPPPRNYSDIMRSLAARYNTHPANDYFHRVNGFGVESRPPAPQDTSDTPVGGLFAKLAKQQGGPPRMPAFPVMIDMTSTKALLAVTRVGRGGRSRRKRVGAGAVTEHSPLDLSAAGESAAKRARLSASPSTRSDGDERDRVSNEDRSETRECLCSDARARISAWSVDDVCDFVTSIDICAEYATNFREQRIDGAGISLLTEDHLTGMLQMKLGPALKLRAVLARRLEPCAQCQASTLLAAPLTPNTPKINGSALKPEPRSNTTSPS